MGMAVDKPRHGKLTRAVYHPVRHEAGGLFAHSQYGVARDADISRLHEPSGAIRKYGRALYKRIHGASLLSLYTAAARPVYQYIGYRAKRQSGWRFFGKPIKRAYTIDQQNKNPFSTDTAFIRML
jgi:hypothetical protein